MAFLRTHHPVFPYPSLHVQQPQQVPYEQREHRRIVGSVFKEFAQSLFTQVNSWEAAKELSYPALGVDVRLGRRAVNLRNLIVDALPAKAVTHPFAQQQSMDQAAL